MLRKLLISCFILFSATQLCFAKNLTLYDQPKDGAKSVGTVDSETGFVPIFSSKDGNWMKVGNPQNGDVGWIKSSDLSTSTSGFTFTEHTVNTGKGPQQFIVQFGVPKQINTEQSKAMIKKFEDQQAAMQKDMQQMMQNLYINTAQFPMIIPVVVVPTETMKPASTKQK